MKMRTLVIAVALVPLAACTPNDTTMGGALRHNMAMQTIDPDPKYAGSPAEGGDGERAAAAVDRYKKGNVKQPEKITTTSGVGTGSGSN